ncbi:MAG: methyltransferase domain-containing protein [bacterium]
MPTLPLKFDPAMRAVLFGPDRLALLPRDRIIDFCRLIDGMTVADLGCGNGFLLAELSHAVGATGQVLASDLQASMLADAETLVSDRDLQNVTCALAGESTIPVPDGSCDRAMLCQVWHNLADQEAYCAELARILKPGGEVIVVNWEPVETGIGPRVWRRWSQLQTARFLESVGYTVTRTVQLTWANYGVAARVSG